MTERLYLYDTTLRDGGQTHGVDFTTADKVAIAQLLDQLGVDYVEGGWPGANPTDDGFFANPPVLARAKLCAFGMTRRAGRSAANDPVLRRFSRPVPTRSPWSARARPGRWSWRSASRSTRTCA